MEKKLGERERNFDRLKKAEWLEKNGGPRQRNAERFEKLLAEGVAGPHSFYRCTFPGCLKEFWMERPLRTHVATHDRGECPYILVHTSCEEAPQFVTPQ